MSSRFLEAYALFHSGHAVPSVLNRAGFTVTVGASASVPLLLFFSLGFRCSSPGGYFLAREVRTHQKQHVHICMYVYTCLHSFMTTTVRCTSLVFASTLFSIFFFDASMSNNHDNNSKKKKKKQESKSKKNAVLWFKREFQRFMNPLLLCI